MTAALVGAVATIAVALLGFATTYYLKQRDERRQGAAAERLLRSQLQRALELLVAGGPASSEEGALRIAAWDEQAEKLSARFGPTTWDQINNIVDVLENIRMLAEADLEAARDNQQTDGARRALVSVIKILDRREQRWLRWHPWVARPDDTAGARGRRVLVPVLPIIAGAILAYVGLAALVDGVRDPIVAESVEAEARELVPSAGVVNCTGDDRNDRWRCVVVSSGCAASERAAGRECGLRKDVLAATADDEAQTVSFRLVPDPSTARSSATAGNAPEAPTSPPLWIGHLTRRDAPIALPAR